MCSDIDVTMGLRLYETRTDVEENRLPVINIKVTSVFTLSSKKCIEWHEISSVTIENDPGIKKTHKP